MSNNKRQQQLKNALELVKKGSNTLDQPAVAPLDTSVKNLITFSINSQYAKKLKKDAFGKGKTMSSILESAFNTYLDTLEKEERSVKRNATFRISEKNIKKIRKYSIQKEISINKIVDLVLQKYFEDNTL